MVFSPSFHKLRRAQRHIFFKVLSVFDHFAHHRGADVLILRFRDQQHRFERAVRHIAIDERKLLLGVKIHAVAHAAHEKLRVFAQRVVGQKSAAELSFHIGELLDARAHERELLLVGEHRVRLRPILMTSLAMIVGLIPLMLAMGVGAHGNRTLGASAIGGMLIGMIFQIFIVPVLFVVFQWLQEKVKPMEWDSLDESEVEAEIEQYSPNTHK